jgi:hypothetical protein
VPPFNRRSAFPIVAAHADGQGWSAIARQLNEEDVPTAQGGALGRLRAVQSAVSPARTPVRWSPTGERCRKAIA